MFKFPALPTARAGVHELADFAEFCAWSYGSTSAREIVGYLNQIEDNDRNEGCNDNESMISDELDEVMIEIDRRQSACGGGYPFELDESGTILRHNEQDENHRGDIYRYLLLSTRLNMQNSRNHAGVDGTKLLEEVSAQVLQCYLGVQRAKAIVFGTAVAGGFADKVDDLCIQLGEGVRFRNLDTARTNAKDDKLDLVAWIPFTDNSTNKLIVFGQCKTGTNWGQYATQLQPRDFCLKWMERPIAQDPVRALCVSEAADRSHWSTTTIDAGLLFDRCRLVDFCERIEDELLGRVRSWNVAAKSSIRI